MQLPVITFIQTRLAEVDPNFEVREGTAHYDLFIIPQQFMMQPLNDFMTQRRVGQSVRQMLMDPTPDTPTTFSSTDVDDAASNLFVTRDTGSISTGSVRVFYLAPEDIEFPALTAQFTAGSLNFFNSSDYTLSASQMALQSNGSLFYADIPIQAEQAGAAYAVAAGAITGFVNGGDYVQVTNLAAMSAATDPQTNTELLNQVEESIGVRDLETVKGINAILKSLFPFLQEIVSIGMGDPEMQRDIIYNVHVGGCTDVYLKTQGLTTTSTTINGLVTDTTREVPINLHIPIARNSVDAIYPPYTGTPSIAPGSERLVEDIIPTAASLTSLTIPSMTGVDLSATPWINITVDSIPAMQINISGATPSATQNYEIVNFINAAFGLEIASVGFGNTVVLTSPTVGQGSQIVLNTLVAPISNTMNASNAVFGIATVDLPYTVSGIAPAVYLRGVDYQIDYVGGNIYQTSFSSPSPRPSGRQTITSGQTMINLPATNLSPTGSFTKIGSLSYLDDSTANMFLNDPLVHVRVGDLVTINSINGNPGPGVVDGILIGSTYSVAQVTTTQRLLLSNFNPTASTSANTVNYTIVSQQVVNVTYSYNPISIDVGGQVILPDGITRGIRPGRSAFTITNTPFIKILSIQQVDPDTGEAIGDPLNAPGGYGDGGYGDGGYGIGTSGDYQFVVNVPNTRFSVFEDSMILFDQSALSNSYTVTYLWDPQLQGIHSVTRNDEERVTGADVLVKTFIPCFVDMAINVRIPASNTTVPSTSSLATSVSNYVGSVDGLTGVDASAIITLLEGLGVNSIQNPFTMTGTILNPDGSTTIITSTDLLVPPTVTLPSQTNNFTTPRIVHFFPGNITVTEI